jgi:predicted nucleic acid-binding protein
VWAEISGFFPDPDTATSTMERLGVEFSSVDVASALRAGSAWKIYRERGGRRQRVIADFLIGAHALARADRLLTRDRGFYRTYFRQLRLIDPSRV